MNETHLSGSCTLQPGPPVPPFPDSVSLPGDREGVVAAVDILCGGLIVET
jgi:hypothetical protein